MIGTIHQQKESVISLKKQGKLSVVGRASQGYMDDILFYIGRQAYPEAFEKFFKNKGKKVNWIDIDEYIKKENVRIMKYSPENEKFFEFIPSKDVSEVTPILPAIFENEWLYYEGLVYIPEKQTS